MLRRSLLKIFGLKFLGLTGLAAFADAKRLEADGLSGPPGAVFNQVGYLPGARKVATVPAPHAAGTGFQILPEFGKTPVFTGTLGTPVEDAASGDRVAVADFSGLTVPGTYRLAVDGRNSALFSVASDVYRDPLRLAMRSFYGQRCGCAVDLGEGYSHAACHAAGAYHATSGRSGLVANHGGWHDAGDYGRYVVNSGITVGTLLWAWELYPQALHGLRLQIPESNGKTPDYLAEIRWNLEWMLSLQDQDGGVWHKQTSEKFCGFVMPDQDTMVSYVIGTGTEPYKSTCATADLASVAAIAARCYGPYDAEFAGRCLAAAKAAWSWAIAHPSVVFANPKGIETGAYDDKHCEDEMLWASAELWRTTGEAQYEQAFLKGGAALPAKSSPWVPSWSGVAPMAYWSWLLAETMDGRKTTDAARAGPLKEEILQRTMTEAQTLLGRAATSGYGTTLALEDYIWGSNSVAANQSLLLLIAHRLQPDAKLFEAALGNLHYLLGRNCFGVSWVTQVGSQPFEHPHHRPSIADGIAKPWPGLLSGGPNAHPSDPAAMKVPKQGPMRMWKDDEQAFSMNEVAINWNAPLVFLLAAASGSASL